MTSPSVGDMILKCNELEGFVETAQAALDTQLRPYKEGIVAIKNFILQELQAQGLQNFKAEGAGTAYQVTTMSVKVDNPDAFIDFVSKEDRWDMLSPSALKEPVKDWLEKSNGVAPPGLSISYFTKCNIRRT